MKAQGVSIVLWEKEELGLESPDWELMAVVRGRVRFAMSAGVNSESVRPESSKLGSICTGDSISYAPIGGTVEKSHNS